MIIKRITWMVLLFIGAASADSLEMHIFQQGLVKIIYAHPDSVYINPSNKLLTTVLNELSRDFKIEKHDSINIYIVPSRSAFRELAKDRLPDWTAAFASPHSKSLYVKSPRWDNPQADFYSTLAHELVHLIMHAHMGNRRFPRWMDEGLAVFYSNEKQWQSATAISKAMLTDSIIPLSEIEQVLDFHKVKADLAYQQSYSAVRYILEFYDIDGMRAILDELRQGKSMDDAFYAGTASRFDDFELEWRSYIYHKHRWDWLQEFDTFIWLFVLMLLPFVYLTVKRRQKRIQQKWDESVDPFNDDPTV